jgi:hypothetical protein
MSKKVTTRIRVLAVVLSAACLFQLPAKASDDATDGRVIVTWTDFRLTVQVSQPTPLATILNRVCAATAARCEGTEKSATAVVAPLILSGGWNEILATLLEDFDYVSTIPSEGEVGRLLVMGLAGTPDPPSAAANQAAPEPKIPPRDRPFPGPRLGFSGQEPAARRASPRSSPAMARGIFSGRSGLGTPRGGSRRPVFQPEPASALQPAARTSGTGPSQSDIMADFFSKVVSAPKPSVFPLPDSDGNPIPFAPAPGQPAGFPIGN